MIPLYDVPYLLKSVRNNLLNNHLCWNTNDGVFTAKWDDIISAYMIDAGSSDVRLFYKITNQHVPKRKIKKIKIFNAVQVLNQTMVRNLNHIAIIIYSLET